VWLYETDCDSGMHMQGMAAVDHATAAVCVRCRHSTDVLPRPAVTGSVVVHMTCLAVSHLVQDKAAKVPAGQAAAPQKPAGKGHKAEPAAAVKVAGLGKAPKLPVKARRAGKFVEPYL